MKKTTLIDVAREATVSRSAVARVLLGTGGDHVRVAPATWTRIEEAARRLDYTPNRSAQLLKGKGSRILGVILDTRNTPVMSQRLFALEREASQRGYRLLVGHAHGQAEPLTAYVRDFDGWGAEAIFCLFDLAPGRDERARACFGKFRKVVFHGRPAWPGGYCVRVDTAAAIRAAVDHLVARGKRRPGLALWNREDDELMELRRVEFLKQAAAHGVEGIVWDAAAEEHEPTPTIPDRGIDYLVRENGADAILASNDIWATRFIQQLQKRRLRIPEKVAVIGYDNLDIASVISPSLTTIDQAHDDYAHSAIKLLLGLATGQRITRGHRTLTIAPHLVVREST